MLDVGAGVVDPAPEEAAELEAAEVAVELPPVARVLHAGKARGPLSGKADGSMHEIQGTLTQ